MPKNVNKNSDANVKSHYLCFISLIGLTIFHFTRLHMSLGYEMSTLHNLVRPLFLGNTRIFASEGGLILNKREQRGQLSKEMRIMSMLAT